jgi:hypothetical protein
MISLIIWGAFVGQSGIRVRLLLDAVAYIDANRRSTTAGSCRMSDTRTSRHDFSKLSLQLVQGMARLNFTAQSLPHVTHFAPISASSVTIKL